MKRKYTATILATALLFSLGGCAKDEQHHTPHPDKGVVAISVDLPQGDEEEEGTDYTVEIDGTTADGHEGRYTVSDPLPPGEYTVLAYNTPQGFTVTDGIARVERTDGTVRALTDFINPLPDYLYSGTERITVVADDTLRMNLDVVQRVRGARPAHRTDRDRGRPGTHRCHNGYAQRCGGSLRLAQRNALRRGSQHTPYVHAQR